MKIAVLYGGLSAERQVSLNSGEAVYQALTSKNYQAVKIDVGADLIDQLKSAKPDLAFIALHGKYGEDGTIQGFLEMLGIPYTGSGVLTSSMCIDKIATKKILRYENIPTPEYYITSKREVDGKGLETVVSDIMSVLGGPVVIKAATQGSTIGIYFAHTADELPSALTEAFKYDLNVLVEKLIPGMEITASVLGNFDPVALPLIEITSVTGVYDYEAKYTAGMSKHIIPPRLPEETQNQLKALAVKVYRAMGCRGFSRVDFMVDQNNFPFVLEVNTIPGMTNTSLFPDAARAVGIEFPELIDRVIKLALEKN